MRIATSCILGGILSNMRVTIRQKNLSITPALRVYIEAKLLKPIRRVLEGAEERELPILDLELSRSTLHHKKGKVYHAEANLSLGRKLLRAEADDQDIRAACDSLREELEREILNYKRRARAVDRRDARRVKKDLRLDPSARLYRHGRIRNEGN